MCYDITVTRKSGKLMSKHSKELQTALSNIDAETLAIIDSEYGILELLHDFCGYAQMCNREIVDMKKAIKLYTGIDINPLNEEQLAMLRKGGDTLTHVREIIVKGKQIKDGVIVDGNYVKT